MEVQREKHLLSDSQNANLVYLRALANIYVGRAQVTYRGQDYAFCSSYDPSAGAVRCSLVPIEKNGEFGPDEGIIWFLCRIDDEAAGSVLMEPTTTKTQDPVVLAEPLYGTQAAWISDFLQNRGEWILPQSRSYG